MAVKHLMVLFGRSQRRICSLIGIQRSTYQYPVKKRNDDVLRQRLRELAQKRRRWGCPQLHRILRREGLVRNHKRTERIYREENLSIRCRKRKKTTSELRIQVPDAERPNQQWAMDFMSDALFNGRKIRLLTLIDEYSRECLAIEVDNGPEFISKAMDAWAYQRQIQLQFSRPGKPVDNRFIESFNGRFRDECLNDNWFMSLQNARDIVETWRIDYNETRPHSSLNDLTPQEFYEKEQQKFQLNLVQSTG
jgi:putative transposase